MKDILELAVPPSAPKSRKPEMPILHVQHSVSSFDGWKRAFDNDPVGREAGAVRHYTIHRSVTDPNFVMIDLEFDAVDQAEKFLQLLRELWKGPGASVMQNPEAWIVETVESRDV
jgi:hypothetical protein